MVPAEPGPYPHAVGRGIIAVGGGRPQEEDAFSFPASTAYSTTFDLPIDTVYSAIVDPHPSRPSASSPARGRGQSWRYPEKDVFQVVGCREAVENTRDSGFWGRPMHRFQGGITVGGGTSVSTVYPAIGSLPIP